MKIIAAGISDVGLKYEHNEDSHAILAEHSVFIVADGLGGDIASKLVTGCMAEFIRSCSSEEATRPTSYDVDLSEDENRLLSAITVANRKIFERSIRFKHLAGMGSTVVSAVYSPATNCFAICHVGDSRAYRVRAGVIEQMTRDHSLINEYMMAVPDLTEEQLAEIPKNVLTRALGMQDNVSIDLARDEPRAGDIYLLCTDGVSGMLSDEQIRNTIVDNPDPRVICRQLIDQANEHGGDDNITAIAVRFDDEDAQFGPSATSSVS